MTDVHNAQRLDSALTFPLRYREEGNEFIDGNLVTGDEIWAPLVNAETKEESKQWTHTRYPDRSRKIQTLPNRKKKKK